MPVTLKCKVCSVLFQVPPSRAKQNSLTCSMKCFNTTRKGEGNANWKGGLAGRICEFCNKAFEVKVKVVKRGGGKYCSKSCRAKGVGEEKHRNKNKNRIKKACIVCGKISYIKPSHANKEGFYCSNKCMSDDYKVRMKGNNNPNYRHGKYIEGHTGQHRRNLLQGKYKHNDVMRILHKQGGCCNNCGDNVREKFEVDHIIPIAKGGTNTYGNIQVLCRSCNRHKSARLPIEMRGRIEPFNDMECVYKVCEYFSKTNEEVAKYLIPIDCTHIGNKAMELGINHNAPNLFLAHPAHGYHGLYIELKRPKAPGKAAGRLTPEQAEYLVCLRAEGYAAHVCYGWDEARAVIENYLGEKRGQPKPAP